MPAPILFGLLVYGVLAPVAVPMISATKTELLQIVGRTSTALARVSAQLDKAIEIMEVGKIAEAKHLARKAAEDWRGLVRTGF
jgi:hypothetical protein